MAKKIILMLFTFVFSAALISCRQSPSDFAEENNILVYDHTVDIEGVSEKFDIIFISDTHISLWDDRDTPEVKAKAQTRYNSFVDSLGNKGDETFKKLMEYVRLSDPDLLILGGDITDSAMFSSIEFVAEELSKLPCPYIYELGNHDFEYGSEYFSEVAFDEFLPRLSEISQSKNGFQINEFDEFIVFSADDYGNRYSAEALEGFKSVYNSGKPIILVSHMPLEPQTIDFSLWNKTLEVWGTTSNGNSKVLLGPNSCPGDAVTQEFINLVLAEDSPVALVLSGHIHFRHKDMLNSSTLQIISGTGYEGNLVKVTIE